MRRILLSAFIGYILLIYYSPFSRAQSNFGGTNLFTNSGMTNAGINNPSNTLNNLSRPSIPIGKESLHEEQSNWVPAILPPFPIRYLSLPSLSDAEKEIFSQNYFVVINDSNIKSFAQLYKDNRIDGISSLVTADSIIHPLCALQNNIRLKVIECSLSTSLESLLISMIRNNEIDYKDTEDAETKEEIKYNLAFLTVAIKLLMPDFPLPSNPAIRQLVTAELNNFKKEKFSQSTIFNRSEDFSVYKPVGFYKATPSAEHFYSCYQWLCKSYLELSDTSSDTTMGNGNEFRRAILLFRSLMKVSIKAENSQKTESGLAVWKRINKIVLDLSINSANRNIEQDTYLLPDSLAKALSSSIASEVSVSSLSNPLNRTRLLLTIRSNAPRQFNYASIFSLSRKDTTKEKQLKFHLFMPLYTPEQDISFTGPVFQHENSSKFNYIPVALLLLQNNGVNWANKILTKNSSKLDEEILNQLAEKQNTANLNEIPLNSFWKIFSTFSKPYPEQTQLLFQTEHWRSFCLERQAAAWIDNFLANKSRLNLGNVAIQTKSANSSSNSAPNTDTKNADLVTISSTIRKLGIGAWRTNNNFNYLEPALDLYNKLAESQSNMESSLTESGLFPNEYIAESRDFIRLLRRLASIAKLELNLEFPKNEDQALLGTIDKLLSIVESPLPAKLFVSFPATASNPNSDNSQLHLTGVNMEMAYPATLFVIVQYKRSYYLMRGATYSYFEQCGEEINEKHWRRQVEFAFLETPFWCQPFQRTHASQN